MSSIDRGDTIEILKDLQKDHLQFCLIPFRQAIERVQALPSADRPQAEWRDLDGNFVPLDKDGCTTASAWCSNCGEWLTGSDEYWTNGRFCPNCGYQMRKE